MSIGTRIKEARKDAKLSQQKLADKVGIKQSTISELETGESAGTTMLATFASILGVNALWLETGKGDKRRKTHSLIENKSTIIALHPDDEQSEGMVYVQESRISFAAGNGRIATYDVVEDEEPATYRLSWFQKNGINPDRVRRFRVSGDSMEPMLFNRDTILINTDETNVIDNKLYAIRYGDELRVKKLLRKLDGTLILRSVNPEYKDEEVSPELAQEHISIIGRVRDASGSGGL